MSLAPNLSGFSKEEILETLNEIRLPLEVAIYNSTNEFNFGGIIRTCHNYLVSKVWGINIEWYYRRAAMTALKWEKKNLNLVSLEDFIENTKGRSIVAFERRPTLKTEDIRSFTYPSNPIFLFGSEKYGIPDELLKLANNNIVSIPGRGFVNDMNVGVAVGIAIHDFYHKFTVKGRQ